MLIGSLKIIYTLLLVRRASELFHKTQREYSAIDRLRENDTYVKRKVCLSDESSTGSFKNKSFLKSLFPKKFLL